MKNLYKYPDGSSYIKLYEDTETYEMVIRINSYEDLWNLHQYVDAYNSAYMQQPFITIPNLIDAQADRRFEQNQSFGLKLVCEFLNNMKAQFRIFHPHNPEVVEAMIHGVTIQDNSYFIKEVLSEIYCEQNNVKRDKGIFYHIKHDLSNLILMSSDAGGFKPLMSLCDKIGWQGETFSASKARDSKTGKLTQFIDRQDFEGKDILIVDDICVYGGTFKGLAKLLRQRNCGKLYLAVSHMTVQNLGQDPVTNYFDKVFTTNSKYDEYYTSLGQEVDKLGTTYPENLEIIKLLNI